MVLQYIMEMTSIVLAGGKSMRLGRDKALEEIGGRSLIKRVIERLSLLGNEIIVVTSSSHQLPDLGVKMVFDSYPGKGNLIGIYSRYGVFTFPGCRLRYALPEYRLTSSHHGTLHRLRCRDPARW